MVEERNLRNGRRMINQPLRRLNGKKSSECNHSQGLRCANEKIKKESMKYCFVFICQQGELEIKSMLLAASLKENLKCNFELVAAIPQPESRWGKISVTSEKLIQQLGIRKASIENQIDLNYPIGNKLSCLGIESDADKIVFLDSDILCVSQFDPKNYFIHSFNAKPADIPTFKNWKPVYELFNLELPTERVISTTSNEKMYPYFNAGMITIDNNKEFSSEWIECCKKIDESDNILNKRPWLDQIGLPIVLKKLNWDYGVLDERFNFPAHQKKMPQNLPFLCHYHFPQTISEEKRLRYVIDKSILKYPLLLELTKDFPQWSFLSDSKFKRILKRVYWKNRNKFVSKISQIKNIIYYRFWDLIPNKNENKNIIITGIPRSGTSYLCKLLNSVENSVVINEPEEVMDLERTSLWRLRAYYKKIRFEISKGKKIWNKIQNGKIIEDTAKVDDRKLCKHDVLNKKFLLSVKNPLVFLSLLPYFNKIMPKSRIVVCIRNPIDTIASWKKSFPHLSDVIFEQFPKIFFNKAIITKQQRKALSKISATEDFEIKRALLWNYLVKIIEENMESVSIIRYEDFIIDPNVELKKVLKDYSELNFDFPKSEIRTKRNTMNEDEISKVKNICRDSALKFGYNL